MKTSFSDFDPDHCAIFEYKLPYSTPLVELLTHRYKSNIRSNKIIDFDDFIQNRIRVNGQIVAIDYQLKPNDILTYLHHTTDEEAYLHRLEIIFENEDLIAIEKPVGLPVTPNATKHFNSIVNLLKAQLNNKNIAPLHRLDIDTSGVLLFTKKTKYSTYYNRLFEMNTIDKQYQTIVFGHFPKHIKRISGKIVKDDSSRIYSKFKLLNNETNSSLTEILNITSFLDHSELEIKAVTGKTNQIRIHLAHVGHPIIGDKKYFPDETAYLKWFSDDYFDDRLLIRNHILTCKTLSFKDHTQAHVSIQSNLNEYNSLKNKIKKITKS